MRLLIVGAACGAALTAVGFVGADTVRAQQVVQARSFEVDSVRLTTPQSPASRTVTNRRVDLTNITLRALLRRAFQIKHPSQLSAPDWVGGVAVDIHAVIPDGSGREHIPEMLRALLMTRFGLRAHAEPRPTDVYELVAGNGALRIREVPALDELDTVLPADPSGQAPPLDRTTDSIDGRLRSIFTNRRLIIITERQILAVEAGEA